MTAEAQFICDCSVSIMKTKLTGIIEKEDDMYAALCPELNVASQGETLDEARKNLTEALELFFECADDEEIKRRLSAPPLDVSNGIRNAF